MKLSNCGDDMLRLLASMPFLDRLDMVSVSGWSRGSVYEAIQELEAAGLAASIPHATELIPPTRRFHVTASGLRRLSGEEGVALEEILRRHPVSQQWRRVLLERLDAVAVVYRLVSSISNVSHPIYLRWYRAQPFDASLALPDRRTVGIIRQGRTADRTGFSKRIRRLLEGPLPGALLLILPDDVRMRQVRRLLKPARVPAFMALERDVVLAGEDAIWSTPSLNGRFDLRAALKRAHPGLPLRVERRQVRASIPWGITSVRPGPDLPGCLLPSLIKPTEKRVLDLVSDWPWMTSEDVAGILGVSGTRVSQLLKPLEESDLVTRVQAAGRRLALTDLGLAMLARRDRASVGVARKRWSVRTSDPHAPFSWHNISGRRSRQLLRYIEHTAAVHRFVAGMACQARSAGWEVAQIDPPHRASRYFQHDGKLRSVQPDAFGILRNGDRRCGRSSWSGNDAPYVPLRWPIGSRPTFATSRHIDPLTTTAQSRSSWSCVSTTLRKLTS